MQFETLRYSLQLSPSSFSRPSAASASSPMAELAAAVAPCVIVLQHFDRISLLRIIEQLQSLLAVTVSSPPPPPSTLPTPSETSCVKLNESLHQLVAALPKSPFSGLPLISPKSLSRSNSSSPSQSPLSLSPLLKPSPSPSPSRFPSPVSSSSPTSSRSPLSPPSACPLNTLGSELSESKDEFKEKPEITPLPSPVPVPHPAPLISSTQLSSVSVSVVPPSDSYPQACLLNTLGGSPAADQKKDEQQIQPPSPSPSPSPSQLSLSSKSKSQRRKENRKAKKKDLQKPTASDLHKEWLKKEEEKFIKGASTKFLEEEIEYFKNDIPNRQRKLCQSAVTRAQKEKIEVELKEVSEYVEKMEKELKNRSK